MSDAEKRGARLVYDERGAAMVTGVMMGAFLIGTTWFVFGIAKSLVFRERVQEAADAGAFASAVLQAKGMNLIAAINLVLFAITAVWVVLRTFEHVMFLLQKNVIGNASNCHGTGCHMANPCEGRVAAVSAVPGGAVVGSQLCNVAYGLQEVRDINRTVRKKVGDLMDKTFPALGKVQSATARLAPAAGTASSLALGAKFGHLTIALSSSLLPAEDLYTLGTKISPLEEDDWGARPLGLPVVDKTFGSLCRRAADVAANKVRGALKAIPVLGEAIDLPIFSDAVDAGLGKLGETVEGEFCSKNDWAGNSSKTKIFGESGPKGMFRYAENGNDLLQVWAFTRGEMDDHDERKVAVASKTYDATTPHHSNWYVAQAEMYFDCDGAWGDGACNANDNAIYNMRWRARMHRVRKPDAGDELGAFLKNAIINGKVKDAVKEGAGLNDIAGDDAGFGELAAEGAASAIFDKIWGELTSDVPLPQDNQTPYEGSKWFH